MLNFINSELIMNKMAIKTTILTRCQTTAYSLRKDFTKKVPRLFVSLAPSPKLSPATVASGEGLSEEAVCTIINICCVV
jgi:hypothetical protein